ncbi:uncharacterized protein LOC143354749 isoform X2 [Halictus rubicundus]|uniref:uncharacterized protein LOC143354749 isoform X2 n=1 Tax=Halictus rubicundus TaxID=77578 RepID=UPI004036AFDC
MAAPQASSRLELLQARFQQKQLQEKEQKLLQLYDQQQQRAYQVVQRGSAGSNGSSYGSSVSQHTVTKTSSNSHTTSTSQGGKVRQMFDERRQTTVKGIDRSYPLEPLENKPRKQANGNVQKNGNSSVNRHSVTVKRVARADVNSNLNAGKPIVSYHEEITRESYGTPSSRRHPDDDEFGNENHVSQYANGNHRDEIQIEEVLDEDTIERNRMMAKLHLMEYDETLKHRIKNDLESEEFPEDFMADVPDKLPKQILSKKLSQAEARLERFRNANAKRISNATKNTSSSQVPKKRAEPGLPGKASSSKGNARNASERLEEMLSSSDSERTAKRRDYYEESERSGTHRIDSRGQFARLSSDSSRNGRFRRRTPTFFCEEPEESATTCAIDSKTRVAAKPARRLSPDFSSDRSRSGSPRFFCKESEKSAKYAIDPNTTRRSSDLSSDRSRSGSPRFFRKESEKSATTYAIDSKAMARSSPDFSKDVRSRSGSPKFFCKESEESATTYAIDPRPGLGSKTAARSSPDYLKDRRSGSGSPRFFGKESEKSATTYAIDSKAMARSSPDFSKDVRSRSGSPKFFCKESEESATTYAIDSRPGLGSKTTARSSPDYLKDRRSRSGSPRFFGKESEKSATTYAIDSKAMARSSPDSSKDVRSRSGSPKFFCKESEKSATTYAIDPRPGLGSKTAARSSPDYLKDRRSRSGSPRFFGKESEKSATTYAIDSKATARSSPDSSKDVRSRSGSPKFFCKESEKSATTYAIDPRPGLGSKTAARSSPDYLKDRRSRSGSPRFFGKESEKSATTYAIDSKATARSSPDSSKDVRSRSGSPKFFCKESEKSATTYAIDPRPGLVSKTAARSSPDYLKDRRSRSGSPKFLGKESEKLATTYAIDAKTGLGSKTRRLSPDFSIDRSQSGRPRFFCKESEKSATTYAIDPKAGLGLKASGRSTPDFSKDGRSQSGSPKFFCKESDESATTYAIDSKSKKKLASDLSKNRFIVKIEPDSEFINKNSRESPVTTDDTVDKYIKDHNLDRVRTPSPTGSLKNYTSSVKIDSKSTRTGSTNVFERLTRDRGSSPQFLHQGSRKSPISVTSTKRRDFISKSPDKIHNVPRDHAKMSPGKHDVSRPRAASKSPDFAKTLRKSNASPQYFSDRSATIMFVTPETITKTKTGYSKPATKARSPTLSISKVDVANGMIGSRRRKSVENIDESSKQRIRSSVSRYFEQCGKAARSEEARARDSVEKSRAAGNADACRVSSPVSLKRVEPVSPMHKSPQLYREAPGKFIATSVDRSRSGTPEFFCYETDKMATTVSLKPRPGTSPEPVRSESSDVSTTIKNVDDSSRSSSPSGTQYMTDKDKRILGIFPSRREQPKCLGHAKSPLSTNKFALPKGKPSKNSDVFNVNKDRKPVGRRSTPSGSPEFFCYETDKMATTASLKPRPSKDSRDYSRSPEPSRSESRSSKSPEISIKNIDTSRSSSPVLSQYLTDSDRATPGLFSSKNDRPGSSKDLPRKHSKSPSTSTYSKGKTPKNSHVFDLPKDTKSNSRSHSPRKGSLSPDFFCYETEKSASLRASSKSSRSSGHADTLSKIRSSKSPEQSPKDPKGRGGSGNVLRSTRLIRDIMKRQGNRENACAPWRDSGVSDRKERASSVGDVGSKQRSKTGSSRSIVDRPTTPTTSSRRKLPDESSPKSVTSAETISEIQETTMTDQYAKQDRFQFRGTYSKSSRTCSSSGRSDTFTSSLTKQVRNRRPPLDSAIFSSSKRDRSSVESRRETDACSEKATRSCNSNESVFRDKKRRTMEDPAGLASLSESLPSEVQTASLSRQPPTLGSIELVRKVMESGTRAAGKTLETREADEQEGTQRRPSSSVSGAAAVYDGRSSSTNYERTDSVESALRRFDSIDTEAGVELQESVTEKRQTPEESRAEGSANDSSTISLKALDQDANSSGAEREQSATRSKRTSGKASRKEEERRRKKIPKITSPSEMTGRVRSLTCRRRLFQDDDVEARSLRKIGSRSETSGPVRSVTKKASRPSTGASDSDLSLSVKQLRSIEDIRKSFGDVSSDREAARAKAAIAGSASRDRSGRPRVSGSVACDRIGKESLAKRSENVGASRDSERFVKSATRFSRVQKSPSLDSTKVVETNSRTRRSVLSPSKSPDMVTRRPSTELKASDTRSTKRTTPTKDAEPIGSRKTTTTTTTTRKSTDAVDGATVLENGLHLQDQTVETKYDNEPQTPKKTFVIDYEEQPPKENNGPLPRKPLLKKPSIEKQTPSTPMQASTSNPKSKMTLRAKTTNLSSSSSRSSASAKTGSNCTPDLLVPCKICGRSFAQDRVTLHEQICAKTGQKRRKLFDSVMSRVKGTELEKFVKKGCAKKQPEKPPEPKSNWRRKHEDFINAIRSAKQVQAHLAAGGKLSDLPPPPPSDTSDYVQCPHCGRKFNKSAAERHIPKCEHMLHNKPVHSRAPKPRR